MEETAVAVGGKQRQRASAAVIGEGGIDGGDRRQRVVSEIIVAGFWRRRL